MQYYETPQEQTKKKIVNFFEDIWPTVYRYLNDFLSGVINFIKEILTGLWR